MSGYELLIIKGPNEGQAFLLKGDEVIIGRDPDCELTLDDVTLSRKHAKIALHFNDLAIEDLGSANGVFVNGVQEKKSVLRVEDRLTLGKVEMRLRRATGMSDSTAMTARSQPSALSMMPVPSRTDSARSRISISSQLMYGSHSAPFTISSLTG